jgi:TonB-dependent SusC/RagA subfamily outer membrane receptor
MKNRNIIFVLGLFLPFMLVLWSFKPISGPVHPVLESILRKFEDYFSRLPQQKVYIHTDKSNYSSDETVWFKAYLVNAKNHKPDSSTSNLYVDLINPSGYIVQTKLIRMTQGLGNADFSFQDTIPEGIYKIRAFTNWMMNLNKNFFFEKEIYVANPEFRTYVTRDEVHKIKKENRRNRKNEVRYDIQFLPEGGHLLSGVENKLGFKVLNNLGHGIKVDGEIRDSKGNRITGFSSSELGMGSLLFTPAKDEKYLAFVNTGGTKPVKVKMPEAIGPGVNITASRTKEGLLSLKLVSNFPAGQFPPNTGYFLLGHIRGQLVLSYEFDLMNQQNVLDVATLEFPSGILHLTLFNSYSQPVSERLVFINNHDKLEIGLLPDKSVATSREKVSLKIKVRDNINLPVQGNFSLSVSKSESLNKAENIISYLLLNSDLKGKVENPQFYFSDENPGKESQLDDLMLTQGWRRFSWPGVLSDMKIQPKFENEKGIVISGNTTKEFFNIPLRDIKVTLSVLNEFNDVFTTRSGQKGAFRFENLDYSDTVSVTIEAVRASGRRNLLIYVDGKSAEQDKSMRYETLQSPDRRGEKGGYKEPVDPDADDPFAKENKKVYRLHEEPSASNVIIVDEKNQNYSSVGQILAGRIPGVMVTGNKVNIRGISTIYGNTDPLFLVDGMQVEPEYAMNMNPFDVERIEVLKGPETAIYGSRGGNGVIAIYTKRGKFMKKGILEFKMLGYATPKEYYIPGLEYRSDDPFEDDRATISWIPDVVVGKDGEASCTFFTSDLKGRYFILLEGISKEGIPGVGVSEIEVK